MSRFDRYLLTQFLTLFGFFALVLVLVYWINRAVGLFDRLIGDGQSALVFLEFSLLTLPNVIRIVLPVAAFAATVHVANRLTQDGELVVMQATGFSAFRLARPVLMFGLIVAAMMTALTHFAVPASRAILADRSAEIEANVTARLLTDGQFMHPADGVTFYIREITANGELRDVFLSDDRSATGRTSYSAKRALLVRGDTGPKLVMIDGMSQTLTRNSGRLAVTHFSDFTRDLSGMLGDGLRDARTVSELSTGDLLAAGPALLTETGATRAEFLAEAHDRFAQPFLAIAAALIGFSALLLGAFSRFGLWRQILVAVVMLILMQLVANAATGAALRNPGLWPLVYAAPVIGIGMGVATLALSQRPRRLRRLPPEAAA